MTKVVNGIAVRSSVVPKNRLGFNEWAKVYRVSQAYQPVVHSQAQWMINQYSIKEPIGLFTGVKWIDKLFS